LKGVVSNIIVVSLLLSLFAFALNVQPVRASGIIYIRADGSVDPPTAPIQRQGDLYTLTDNIGPCDSHGIIIQRDNIILDGAGFTVQGTEALYSEGVDLTSRSDVTVRNMKIEGFYYGIVLEWSCNNIICGNSLTANDWYGIWLWTSSNNRLVRNNATDNFNGIALFFSLINDVSKNNIANNEYSGIYIFSSSNNSVSENNVTHNVINNALGVYVRDSSNNNIAGNNVTNVVDGIYIENSSNNSVFGNNVADTRYIGISLFNNSSDNNVAGNDVMTNGYCGIYVYVSSNNRIYHNYFANNPTQIYSSASTNIWDDGYPSGGNYWSDYTTRYPDAVEIDDSSIWNTPYVIDASNQDNYPLMGPWTVSGENVIVIPKSGVSLTFASVISGGITTVDLTQSGPFPPAGFKREGQFYDIATTASFSGPVTLGIAYDDSGMTLQEETSLRLMHWNTETQQWEDVTSYVDMQNNVIYGETNRLSIFAVHSVLIHDLSIFSVHLEKTIVGQGYSLSIDVIVRNVGDFPEDFDVTVDLVSGQISYLSIFGVHMESGSSGAITLTWNTATFARTTYSIRAHVSHVAYEVNTADNDYTDGEVKVTIPGDVDGDWFVNIMDATQIGYYWLQGVPPAPPEVDISGDGIINIVDATVIGFNWLQHA
jgi:parallel beta-helix repeat protein